MSISKNKSPFNFILVDDDPAAHAYHKVMMLRAGIQEEQMIEFFSVDECLNYIESEYLNSEIEFTDVILADLSMPQKDGWFLIEELEKIKSSYFRPLVYLVSNSVNPNDKKKAESYRIVKGFKTKFLETDFFSEILSKEIV